jgi:hypothetical protein
LRTAFIFTLFLAASVSGVASNISSATASDGRIYNTTGVIDAMSGMQLTGATVSATFSGGVASCTFVGNTCTGAGFSVVAPVVDTSWGFAWTITNTTNPSQNSLLQSVTIDLKPVGGGASFNPCVANGSLYNGGGVCFSQNGGVARSITDDGGGSRSLAASVAYTNAVKTLGGIIPVGDLFTQVTFTFSGGFTSGSNFTFLADTDLTPNPEPATVTLVSAALLGLGLLRRKRH